jgi:hypothetical protein
MSDCTAKLCVWVTEFGDPCHIMQTEQYFIHVTDCEGHVLKWCDKNYSFIPTKCGFVEIEVPPGCYSVFGTHTAGPKSLVRPPFGNRLTHVQVVRVNCGDHVCVTLFSPSMWHCGTWFAEAVTAHLPLFENHKINPGLGNDAVKAVRALVAVLPPGQWDANTGGLARLEPPK